MKDLIRALLGSKHCDWCSIQPPSIVDRLCRLDQIIREPRPFHERAVISINNFWTNRLPIWKLGQAWHFRFHWKETSELERPTGLRTICPDGGTCHHQCGISQICFRVACCEPLSGVYPDDVWPEGTS